MWSKPGFPIARLGDLEPFGMSRTNGNTVKSAFFPDPVFESVWLECHYSHLIGYRLTDITSTRQHAHPYRNKVLKLAVECAHAVLCKQNTNHCHWA